MSNRHRALLTGLATVGIGLTIVLLSQSYPWIREGGQVGPGFIPGLSGLVLLLTGIILTIQSLAPQREAYNADRSRHHGGEESSRGQGQEKEPVWLRNYSGGSEKKSSEAAGSQSFWSGKAAGVLLLSAVAVYASSYIGLLPALIILVFAISKIVEHERLSTSLIMSAGTGGVVWLLFVYILNIPLPTGTIGEVLRQ